MTFNEYQAAAALTRSETCNTVYVAAKLPIEAGEAAQHAIKEKFHGKPIDLHALIEELGDTLWYVSQLAADYGLSLEAIAQINIEKLRKRHGAQYNAEHYVSAVLTAEQEAALGEVAGDV
jgi:NTP pyrophosphatase (non-canonical NTP hydrolase)